MKCASFLDEGCTDKVEQRAKRYDSEEHHQEWCNLLPSPRSQAP